MSTSPIRGQGRSNVSDPQGKVTQFAGLAQRRFRSCAWARTTVSTATCLPERDIVSSSTATGASERSEDHRPLPCKSSSLPLSILWSARTAAIYLPRRLRRPRFDIIDSAGRPQRCAVLYATDGELPEGLALSPDQSMLVVTDAVSRYSWSFQIAADGTLKTASRFTGLSCRRPRRWAGKAEPQGVVEDVNGRSTSRRRSGFRSPCKTAALSEILNPPIPGGGPLTGHHVCSQIGDSELALRRAGRTSCSGGR